MRFTVKGLDLSGEERAFEVEAEGEVHALVVLLENFLITPTQGIAKPSSDPPWTSVGDPRSKMLIHLISTLGFHLDAVLSLEETLKQKRADVEPKDKEHYSEVLKRFISGSRKDKKNF